MSGEWPLPSDGELEILRVLWRRGPSTVREVHAALSASRGVVYNTVGKLLQIMEGKGLVACDAGSRAHVYRSLVPQDEAEGRLLSDLAERAFGGSAAKLVLRALEQERITAAEREAIRRLLAELDGGAGRGGPRDRDLEGGSERGGARDRDDDAARARAREAEA